MRRVAVLLALMAIGCQGSAKPAASLSSLGNPLDVSPGKVWGEYGGNEVAADAKYAGKTLEVSAFLDPLASYTQIQKLGDEYCILLPPEQISAATAPPCFLCYLSPAAAKAAADKKPGDSFFVRGICKGIRKDSQYEQGYALVLKGCEFADTSKRPE